MTSLFYNGKFDMSLLFELIFLCLKKLLNLQHIREFVRARKVRGFLVYGIVRLFAILSGLIRLARLFLTTAHI